MFKLTSWQLFVHVVVDHCRDGTEAGVDDGGKHVGVIESVPATPVGHTEERAVAFGNLLGHRRWLGQMIGIAEE
jgi:hypothetical protein